MHSNKGAGGSTKRVLHMKNWLNVHFTIEKPQQNIEHPLNL